MKLHKYSLNQLTQAVLESSSLRQVLIKLHVAPYGGNYETLKKAVAFYGLNISHFKGQAWNKDAKLPTKYTLDDYLLNKRPIQSYKLKNRLLNDRSLSAVCSNCNNESRLNQPILLELDHINGNNKENRINHLRLLCPNCHTLTPTYRSKNRSMRIFANYERRILPSVNTKFYGCRSSKTTKLYGYGSFVTTENQ